MSDKLKLSGKVAIVAGGGRGIGRAIALGLAQAGADVVPTSRTASQLEEVVGEIKTLGRSSLIQPCDISQVSQIQALVERVTKEMKRIDILVNASAISPIWKPIEAITDAEWEQILGINLNGAFKLTRELGKKMIELGNGGSIIHIASVAGMIGTENIAAYAVSKSALIGLMKAQASEWAKYMIRVNAIAPGWVYTEMARGVLDHPKLWPELKREIPLQRYAKPEEIAPLAVYLASGDSSYATGQVFVIDGGQTI
jgi:NAD(P)-dependent dehydrogenase (short-subunit alcohol dehydrogenase family)